VRDKRAEREDSGWWKRVAGGREGGSDECIEKEGGEGGEGGARRAAEREENSGRKRRGERGRWRGRARAGWT
jgi:hypothetical protein